MIHEFLHNVNIEIIHGIEVVTGWSGKLLALSVAVLGIINAIDTGRTKIKSWLKKESK